MTKSALDRPRSWQRLLIVAGLLVALGIAGVVIRAIVSPSVDGPSIRCAQRFCKWQKSESNTPFEHTFVLENVGNEDLKISRIAVSCDCIVVDRAERMIPPGYELAVPVHIYLDGKSDDWTGRLLVASNDPTQPRLVLKISAP